VNKRTSRFRLGKSLRLCQLRSIFPGVFDAEKNLCLSLVPAVEKQKEV